MIHERVIKNVVDSMRIAHKSITSLCQQFVSLTSELNGVYSKSEAATAEL